MYRPFALIAVAALLAPAGTAAQSAGEWWAPFAERLPAAGEPGVVCTMVPDLPACRGDTARDRERVPEGDRRDRRDRADDDERWETGENARGARDKRGRDARRGNGPPFCRNGEGHPVHGRQWCRDKGWDEGSWRDVSWGDVILNPRERTRDRERLDRGGLLDVLGDVVLRRLDTQGRALGGGALTGRWVAGRTRVLQVRAGEAPLAELMDANRDGRIDRILLRAPR